MFTLSDASTDTKKIIEIIGIVIGVIVAFFVLFRIVLFVKEIFYPTPPPKPTVSFGKLQPQVFPKNATNTTLNYSINTLTGNLPAFTDQVKIYRIQESQPDLLAIDKFQSKVKEIGFIPQYTAISDKIFEWKSDPNQGGIDKTIRVNIVNGNFTITSPYLSDKDLLAGKNLSDQKNAIDIAGGMLSDMQMVPDDVDLSKNTTNLFSINSNGSFSQATSLSNAQIIEVSFYQNDIDKLPIFYEKPDSSNINFLIGGGTNRAEIVAVNYVHQAPSDQYSTYPIKTTNQAFEDLKKGNSYIASYFGNSSNINITDVTLGYYIGTTPQDFLMPVFVFTGDNGFKAYVPAVTDEWINK